MCECICSIWTRLNVCFIRCRLPVNVLLFIIYIARCLLLLFNFYNMNDRTTIEVKSILYHLSLVNIESSAAFSLLSFSLSLSLSFPLFLSLSFSICHSCRFFNSSLSHLFCIASRVLFQFISNVTQSLNNNSNEFGCCCCY